MLSQQTAKQWLSFVDDPHVFFEISQTSWNQSLWIVEFQLSLRSSFPMINEQVIEVNEQVIEVNEQMIEVIEQAIEVNE